MCNFRFVSLFESGGDQPLGFLDRTGPYWIVSARVTRKTHKVRDLQNTDVSTFPSCLQCALRSLSAARLVS